MIRTGPGPGYFAGRRFTIGKCIACKAAYSWTGKPLLREACCPKCLDFLDRTTAGQRSIPWRGAPHWRAK